MLDLKGKNVTIIGLGITGYYMARWTQLMGANVFVSEAKSAHELDKNIVNELKVIGIRLELGGHTKELIKRSHIVIPSPGVPLSSAPLKWAKTEGIQILGELDVISNVLDIPTIAITGTNGKSTVTTFIGELLNTGGMDAFVGGNLGTPPIALILEGRRPQYLVLEISSFQLDISSQFAPHIGILLNVTPDHLDRYDGFEGYVASKFSMFKNQSKDDFAILNADDPVIAKSPIETKSQILRYSTSESKSTCAMLEGNSIKTSFPLPDRNISAREYKLLGIHNLSNLMPIVMVGLILGIGEKVIQKAISSFKPLPHRVEPIKEYNKRVFIDDSKATNVDAVVKAITAIDSPIIIILGGRHKGADYSPIVKAGNGKIKYAVLLGEAKEIIAASIEGKIAYLFASDMKDAVNKAYEKSLPGDCILLSPACSSFDMFRDYKHRGDEFKRAVEELI